MPKRILVISAVYPPMKAPEGDHIMHLCRHFADAGSEVHLLTSIEADPRGNPRVYNTISNWGWRAVPKILKCIRRVKPDAIMIMYVGWIYQRKPMITFFPSFVKLLFPGIERVTMITNTIGTSPAQNLRSKISRAVVSLIVGGSDPEFGTLLRDCSRICVLSEHHGKTLIKRYAALNEKLVLIPPPPILHLSPATAETRANARKRLNIKDDEFLFIFFGYSYPGKGVETLLKAFIALAENLPKMKLMIAGRMTEELDAEGRPYGAMLRELARPLGSRVITGEYDADSDEGSTFLRAADVCVLPFDNGVQLNNSSVSAAMVHGLPVISTRHSSLESAFVEGQNIVLCIPKSPWEMAKKMIKLAEDASLRATLSTGALVFSKKWFSWERTLSLLFSSNRDVDLQAVHHD